MRRACDERGDATTELVLVTPVLLLLIAFVVQFALWYHASHVAEAAAQEGACAAAPTVALPPRDRNGPSTSWPRRDRRSWWNPRSPPPATSVPPGWKSAATPLRSSRGSGGESPPGPRARPNGSPGSRRERRPGVGRRRARARHSHSRCPHALCRGRRPPRFHEGRSRRRRPRRRPGGFDRPQLRRRARRRPAAAEATLAGRGLSCSNLTVTVDTTDFRPGGIVATTVGCAVDLSDLTGLGLPGAPDPLGSLRRARRRLPGNGT